MTTCYDCQVALPEPPPAKMEIAQPASSGNLRHEWVPLCWACAATRLKQGREVEPYAIAQRLLNMANEVLAIRKTLDGISRYRSGAVAQEIVSFARLLIGDASRAWPTKDEHGKWYVHTEEEAHA